MEQELEDWAASGGFAWPASLVAIIEEGDSMKERTHVLLHPYGLPDGWKQVCASTDAAKVKRVVDGYKAAGWSDNIYIVRARGFDDAVGRAARKANP